MDTSEIWWYYSHVDIFDFTCDGVVDFIGDLVILNVSVDVFCFCLFSVLKRFTGYMYRSKLDTDVGVPQVLHLSPFASDDLNGVLTLI